MVTDANGCIAYDSVIVNVVPNYSLFVPNAFTPNGDGVNDELRPLQFGNFELLLFQVYNRWGELMFETNNINIGWDGTYKGLDQEVGSYVYYIRARDPLGKLTEFKGNATLIR
jgi:gliding motility-associated-like protein